ncbi:hypothetical protein NS228_18515 [Methylobacterium indicum]|nr:hypothetical protein NS228_18515 [Methylobacterium indicum]KTS51738.1 hypothetical protein NS230_13365 [Methylobacterium indicum]
MRYGAPGDSGGRSGGTGIVSVNQGKSAARIASAWSPAASSADLPHPGLQGFEWVRCLTYRAATGPPKQGRATDQQGAAEAVRTGLDEALRWRTKRDRPLRVWLHDASDRSTDWRQRMPLVLVIGQDVPWPEGLG